MKKKKNLVFILEVHPFLMNMFPSLLKNQIMVFGLLAKEFLVAHFQFYLNLIGRKNLKYFKF